MKKIKFLMFVLLAGVVNVFAEGELTGKFSVSPNKQVVFSRGNLQYHAVLDEWRFAEDQREYIGKANENATETNYAWIDLFGWGCSGYNEQWPWRYHSNFTTYGDGTNDITGTNYDWGVYNAISNGGNKAGEWRTLTKDEWGYLLGNFTHVVSEGKPCRENASKKFGHCCIDGINGLIILPDEFTMPEGVAFNGGFAIADNGMGLEGSIDPVFYKEKNDYTLDDWKKLEASGAVFLPAAGFCDGYGYAGDNYQCCYSTTTSAIEAKYAYVMFLYPYSGPMLNDWNRAQRNSVRLVKDVETTGIGYVDADAESLAVRIENGRILCGEPFEIYTVEGMNVTRSNGNLRCGIYVVKTRSAAKKVAVK